MRMPSPAIVIAIVALVAALGGSAYAGSKIGFGELSKKAKKQTAGVGQLEYVSTSVAVPPTSGTSQAVAAYCPAGLVPIGGGIRLSNKALLLATSDHPIAGGWAGTVDNLSSVSRTVIVTAICATSRDVEGAPPATS